MLKLNGWDMKCLLYVCYINICFRGCVCVLMIVVLVIVGVDVLSCSFDVWDVLGLCYVGGGVCSGNLFVVLIF